MGLDDVVDSATIVVLTMYCNRESDSPQFRDTYRLGCSLARCHDLHEWNYSIRKWSSDWSLAQFWSCSCHNWVQYSNAFCKRVHLEHGQRGLSGLWDVYRWIAYPDWTPENDIHLKKKIYLHAYDSSNFDTLRQITEQINQKLCITTRRHSFLLQKILNLFCDR